MRKNIKLLYISLLILGVFFSFSIKGLTADYDFGGQTVTFGHVTGAESWEEEPQLRERKTKIEEEYNVVIEFEDIGIHSAEDIITSVISGDPVADVVEVRGDYWETLAAERVIIPLDDYLDDDYFENIDLVHREAAPEYTEFLGQRYAFVGFNFGSVKLNPLIIIWNQEIFEEEGLTTPYELYENGEWTLDNFYELADKLTKDTSGDGEIDQWGFTGSWPLDHANTILSIMTANSATPTTMEDGKVKFGMLKPEAIEAIEFISKLFQNDLYLQTGIRHVEGDSAMHFGHRKALGEVFESDQVSNYGIIPMPRNENMDKNFVFAPAYRLAIPVGTGKDPAALIDLTNALYKLTSDYADLEKRYQESVDLYSQYFVDRRDMEIMDDVLSNWRDPKFRGVFSDVEVWNEIGQIMREDLNPKRVMEEIQPEVQIVLDEMLEQ